MSTTLQIIALSIIFTVVCLIQWRVIIIYRSLCVKLTKTINDMYCKEEGCTNLKYYTTPVDGAKGMLTNYCSKHLMERVENGEPT